MKKLLLLSFLTVCIGARAQTFSQPSLNKRAMAYSLFAEVNKTEAEFNFYVNDTKLIKVKNTKGGDLYLYKITSFDTVRNAYEHIYLYANNRKENLFKPTEDYMNYIVGKFIMVTGTIYKPSRYWTLRDVKNIKIID